MYDYAKIQESIESAAIHVSLINKLELSPNDAEAKMWLAKGMLAIGLAIQYSKSEWAGKDILVVPSC